MSVLVAKLNPRSIQGQWRALVGQRTTTGASRVRPSIVAADLKEGMSE